jgi:hypothetical protein
MRTVDRVTVTDPGTMGRTVVLAAPRDPLVNPTSLTVKTIKAAEAADQMEVEMERRRVLFPAPLDGARFPQLRGNLTPSHGKARVTDGVIIASIGH